MKTQRSTSIIALIALSAAFLNATLQAEVRTFTSSAGTVIRGELVAVNGEIVTIKKEDGQTLTLKLAAFSRADQAWLQSQTSATSTAVSTDPAKATKDAPFVNSLGMKFVLVPGTSILMCIHETRRKDYAAYSLANARVNGEWRKEKVEAKKLAEEDQYPVVCVSWEDANAFCAWLSKKERRAYRLPTDRDWSVAVGIGDREGAGTSPSALHRKVLDVYPWGTSATIPQGAGNYCDSTNQKLFHPQAYNNTPIDPAYNDGFAKTSPVMRFTPNALGIYDLGGNVWELVEDLFNPVESDITYRGSSYADNSMLSVLSSTRVHLPKDARPGHAGFRIVVETTARP
jgi:sulfatase-modifying factor enzyme 1